MDALKILLNGATAQMQPWLSKGNYDYQEQEACLNPVNLKAKVVFKQFKTKKLALPLSLIGDSSPKMLFQLSEENPEAWFLGISTMERPLILKQDTLYFIFELFSTFGVKRLGENISDLYNDKIVLSDILPDANYLIEMLVTQGTFEKRVQFLEAYFLKHLVDYNYKVSLAEYLAVLLYQKKAFNDVKEIENKMGYSRRYLEIKFKDNLGITPIKYSTIFRFQKSIEMLLNSENKYSNMYIAQSCGYYDEAHFIREFTKYSGYTPFQLRKEINKID